MYISFGKTLRKWSGVRIGAGFRVRGAAGAMLACLLAVVNLWWYLMLGMLWLLYGALWLFWKLIKYCIVKPVKWIASKLCHVIKSWWGTIANKIRS